MGRTLKVQLQNAHPELIHDFRNFGEDVFRSLRDEYGVSIEEIDASTSEFCLMDIPKREVRMTEARVLRLAGEYPTLSIHVEEIKEEGV